MTHTDQERKGKLKHYRRGISLPYLSQLTGIEIKELHSFDEGRKHMKDADPAAISKIAEAIGCTADTLITERLVKCNHCGEYHQDFTMEDTGSGKLCFHCYGDAIFCDHCGKPYHCDDMTQVDTSEPDFTGNTEWEWRCPHCLTPDTE